MNIAIIASIGIVTFSPRRMKWKCILIGGITSRKAWTVKTEDCQVPHINQKWQIRGNCSTSSRNRLHYKSSYHWQTITFRTFQAWGDTMSTNKSYSSQKHSEDLNIRKLLLGELLDLLLLLSPPPHIFCGIMKIKDRKHLLALIEYALLLIQKQFKCTILLS